LKLNDNGLTGTIPTDIAQMAAMTTLALDSNSGLTGTIPSDIAQMTAITFLELSNCRLTGTIPSDIAQMTATTFLGLGGNRLTGTIPSDIAQMTAMTTLFLDVNKLSGEVPPLPFAQYTGNCQLDAPHDCTEPRCNHFSCPLPPNSDKCKGPLGNHAGVHCH
jgi:hypothetical protein